MIEEPYTHEKDPNNQYNRVKIPKLATYLNAFSESVLYSIKNKSNCLFVFNDWWSYERHEMLIVKQILKANYGSSEIIKKPGIQFNSKDKDSIINLIFLTQAYQWSVYLYFAAEQITIYLWEGEIADIWSKSKQKGINIKEALESYLKNG